MYTTGGVVKLQQAFLLLECMVYLIITALMLQGVFMFILAQTHYTQKLERVIFTNCALHNALVTFKRDEALMPRERARYSCCEPERIEFKTAEGEMVSWYVDHQRVDHQRLMRMQDHPHGREYAVVLEPVAAQFTCDCAQGSVRFIKLKLSHNDKTEEIIVWLL